MKTENVLYLVAACLASAAFSTGLGGLYVVSALAVAGSVVSLLALVAKAQLDEKSSLVLIGISTASAVSAFIAWRAPYQDSDIMATYGLIGALAIAAVWAVYYFAHVRKMITQS